MYVSAGNTGSEATRSLKSYSRPLIELRQYELREGMRDTLIDLFDRALAHGQEESASQ